MERNSYTRAEVIAAGSERPQRGLLCHECGEYVPVFEDLSEADEQRIRQSSREKLFMMAAKELHDATGCSLEWAKIWVEHEGRPKPAKEPTPCPYCGKPLRTPLAKQCRFCGRDLA